MTAIVAYAPDHPNYPTALFSLPQPETIHVRGGLRFDRVRVAIVGARAALPKASEFAFELAGWIARAGGIVLSGGAVGIDAAAHRGALAHGGATWAVAATGSEYTFPPEHEELYAEIAEKGAMIWPFARETPPRTWNFLRRNGVLVALADAVVVVQAGIRSGALNAARWARQLQRPLWVVPASPWVRGFEGCALEITRGARVLTSVDDFLTSVSLIPTAPSPLDGSLSLHPSKRWPTAREPLPLRPGRAAEPAGLSADDARVYEALSRAPTHIDDLISTTGLSIAQARMSLFRLMMEGIALESPAGFYRRPDS